jgi:hypothetical protein
MATRSGVSRQIRTARSLAVTPPHERGSCDGAITRAHGEIVHRSGLSPGRAWSDLLFTMSDNTHNEAHAGEPTWEKPQSAN